MEKRQKRRVRGTVMTKDDQRDITFLALRRDGKIIRPRVQMSSINLKMQGKGISFRPLRRNAALLIP